MFSVYDTFDNVRLEYNKKILTPYGLIVGTKYSADHRAKIHYDKYMKIINGFEQIYTRRYRTAIETEENQVTTIEDIIKSKTHNNMLYYKLRSNTSLFLLELFKKYDLIQKSTKKMHEITNYGSMADAIAIIDEDMQIDSIFVNDFHMAPRISKYNSTWKDKYPTHSHTHVSTVDQFIDEVEKIDRIDFMFVHIMLYAYQSRQIMLYFEAIWNIYVLLLIHNKLNDGANMIVAFYFPHYTLDVKMLALYCSIFEEYTITTADCNIEYGNCVYLILKNKQPISKDRDEQFKAMLRELRANCKHMGIYDEMQSDTINTIQDGGRARTKEIIEFLAKQSDRYIVDIKITDPHLKKLYKRVRGDVKKYNTMTYIKYLMFYDQVQELYDLDQAGKLTDHLIAKYKKLAMYELLGWSKKYDIRLIELTDYDKWTHGTRLKIYKDVVSYEQDVRIDLKPHRTAMAGTSGIPIPSDPIPSDQTPSDPIPSDQTPSDQTPSDPIPIDQMPSYYADAIQKNTYETRALDHRDMTTYHQVKVQIDYYFRKLTKQIAQRYNLTHGYVTQAWIKMTEILHRVKGLVPMDDRQTLTTFHICELPGAFINALTHFVDTETSYELKWIAQSLNPANLSKHDQREAFGDEAQLVKKHPENYDFGPKKTGDIIDPENIRYYAKHYNKNDLVTADCGLPYRQKDLSYILSFATYLLVFLTTGEHGNALIKRYVPINNNQEIYMMYLFYVSFKKTILFKPRVNYQSQEYYLIGLDYTPIDPDILERLIRFLESYRLQGIVSIDQIPHSFLAQLDKAQHIMLDNLNDFIRKKIYFADNFSELTDTDWQEINHAIKDKIEEWFADVPMKKRRKKRT